jgi:hypothetical protein
LPKPRPTQTSTPKTSEEDQALAMQVTIDHLKAYPDLQGLYRVAGLKNRLVIPRQRRRVVGEI